MIASELVKVFELRPLVGKSSDFDKLFRVEVFRELRSGSYYPIVWTHEYYRVQSRFPAGSDGGPADEPSDEMILRHEDAFGFEDVRGQTVDEVMAKVCEIINEYCELPGE